jgi:hypothetical protein
MSTDGARTEPQDNNEGAARWRRRKAIETKLIDEWRFREGDRNNEM